jgi:hypothetical protein
MNEKEFKEFIETIDTINSDIETLTDVLEDFKDKEQKTYNFKLVKYRGHIEINCMIFPVLKSNVYKPDNPINKIIHSILVQLEAEYNNLIKELNVEKQDLLSKIEFKTEKKQCQDEIIIDRLIKYLIQINGNISKVGVSGYIFDISTLYFICSINITSDLKIKEFDEFLQQNIAKINYELNDKIKYKFERIVNLNREVGYRLI